MFRGCVRLHLHFRRAAAAIDCRECFRLALSSLLIVRDCVSCLHALCMLLIALKRREESERREVQRPTEKVAWPIERSSHGHRKD